MAAEKFVILVCNVCGVPALSGTMVISDLIHMEHPIKSVVDARSHARAKGWRHDKLGRDLCPNCVTTPPVARHRSAEQDPAPAPAQWKLIFPPCASACGARRGGSSIPRSRPGAPAPSASRGRASTTGRAA